MFAALAANGYERDFRRKRRSHSDCGRPEKARQITHQEHQVFKVPQKAPGLDFTKFYQIILQNIL